MPDFDSHGVRLHFQLAGPQDGPPTVMLHGFASDFQLNWVGSLWQQAMTAAGRLVIGLDLRGHGRSEKPHRADAYGQPVMAADVLRLLDHLGIGRTDLVGYSMGARVGLRVAAESPDRLWRAVLGGAGRLRADATPPAIAAALRGGAEPDGEITRTFRDFARSRTMNDLEALACCIEGFVPDLTDPELAGVRVPILFVEGEREDMAPGARRLAELVPGARYLELAGRRHMNAMPSREFKSAALTFLEAPPGPQTSIRG